jgi:hypothetical protein
LAGLHAGAVRSPGSNRTGSSSSSFREAAAAGRYALPSTSGFSRRRRPLPSPPLAASAAHGGGASSAGVYESDTDGQTAEQRLALVKNMIATAELLVPYDRSAVNLGLILW